MQLLPSGICVHAQTGDGVLLPQTTHMPASGLHSLPPEMGFHTEASPLHALRPNPYSSSATELAFIQQLGSNTIVSVADTKSWQFNFRDAPWSVVLREFASLMGFSLTMPAEPQGMFTYYDERQYSASEAIDILNDHLIPLGFVAIQRETSLVLLSTAEPISDQYVPFVSVEQIDFLGRNEIAGAAIPVKGMDVAVAMEEVNAIKSPLGQLRPFSNTGRILVIDTGTHLRRIRDLLMQTGFAKTDLVSFVYQLRHAKADDVSKAINDFLIGNSQSASGGALSPLSQGMAHVTPEATTNSLLIRGTSEVAQQIYRLINDLDRAPREVMLQALIVEVQLGNTMEKGVELGFQDSVLFDRSIVDSVQSIATTATAPNGVQTTNQTILSQVSTPGFNFNGPALGTNAVNPSRVGSQSLSNFGMGRTNGDLGYGGLVLSAGSESVNLLIRALDAKFRIDILSRPQVRTVENVEAFIQVGQQVPIVDGVSVNSVGTANPVVRQDRAGIILKATPRISPGGKVQVVVETEKSAFNLARGTGVPIFTDATTGRVIEAPVKDISTAQTTVSVQSGETIVLGGMITSSDTVINRKVPFLGDIPLLGRLFRYDLNRNDKKELLVFLTPIVLPCQELSDALMAEELAHSNISDKGRQSLERWEMIRETMLAPQLDQAAEMICIPNPDDLPASDNSSIHGSMLDPQNRIQIPPSGPSIPSVDALPLPPQSNFIPPTAGVVPVASSKSLKIGPQVGMYEMSVGPAVPNSIELPRTPEFDDAVKARPASLASERLEQSAVPSVSSSSGSLNWSAFPSVP